MLLLLTPQSVWAKGDAFTVVIDAGHGGHDHGAIDNGTREKDINLGVALRLGEMIKKQLKDVKVVYTRNNDTFVSLQGRADIANKAKGDLFISIHTNSVDKSNKNRTKVAGATVYALGLHKDANNMGVAQRENSVMTLEDDYGSKYQGFDPNQDESYIIFEMAQKKNLSKSIKFANEVQKQLVNTAGRKDRGVHQAGFWVLWATSMPAVLVELDFICNPVTAEFISSDNGQKKLAHAIFNAVKDYYQKESAASQYTPSPQQRQREIEAEKKRLKEKDNKNNSGKQKKNNKSGKKDNNDEALEMTYNSGQAVVLASPSKTNTRRHITTTQQKSTTAKRRRRSENARNVSASRSVDQANLVIEKPQRFTQTQTAQTVANQETPSVGKNTKNNKTKAKKEKTTRKRHSKVQHLESVFTIQILASPDKIKENDKRFAGLSPIRVIKENNIFKYSYGNTTDKSEIEKLLKKVKKTFPDAFIVENKKNVSK